MEMEHLLSSATSPLPLSSSTRLPHLEDLGEPLSGEPMLPPTEVPPRLRPASSIKTRPEPPPRRLRPSSSVETHPELFMPSELSHRRLRPTSSIETTPELFPPPISIPTYAPPRPMFEPLRPITKPDRARREIMPDEARKGAILIEDRTVKKMTFEREKSIFDAQKDGSKEKESIGEIPPQQNILEPSETQFCNRYSTGTDCASFLKFFETNDEIKIGELEKMFDRDSYSDIKQQIENGFVGIKEIKYVLMKLGFRYIYHIGTLYVESPMDWIKHLDNDLQIEFTHKIDFRNKFITLLEIYVAAVNKDIENNKNATQNKPTPVHHRFGIPTTAMYNLGIPSSEGISMTSVPVPNIRSFGYPGMMYGGGNRAEIEKDETVIKLRGIKNTTLSILKSKNIELTKETLDKLDKKIEIIGDMKKNIIELFQNLSKIAGMEYRYDDKKMSGFEYEKLVKDLKRQQEKLIESQKVFFEVLQNAYLLPTGVVSNNFIKIQ